MMNAPAIYCRDTIKLIRERAREGRDAHAIGGELGWTAIRVSDTANRHDIDLPPVLQLQPSTAAQ